MILENHNVKTINFLADWLTDWKRCQIMALQTTTVETKRQQTTLPHQHIGIQEHTFGVVCEGPTVQLGEGDAQLWPLHEGQVGWVAGVQHINHHHFVEHPLEQRPEKHNHTHLYVMPCLYLAYLKTADELWGETTPKQFLSLLCILQHTAITKKEFIYIQLY